MRLDHLAKEAERLASDEVLQHALNEMRASTLEALASCDATDTAAVLRFQAEVRAIDEFRGRLRSYILRAEAEDTGASPYV